MVKVEFEVSTEWCAKTLKDEIAKVDRMEKEMYGINGNFDDVVLLNALTDYRKKIERRYNKFKE